MNREGSRPGAPRDRTTSRQWWDVGLLLFMVMGAAAAKLRGIDALFSPDAPPLVVAALLFGAVLITCVVLVVVPSEAALCDSYGSWVTVVTHIVQAGFFSAVLLFVPLPWFVLRFLTSFLMAGGYFTIGNVSSYYGILSRSYRATPSLGARSSFTRNSIIAGVLLGILGSLAIVGFISRVTSGFNPLAGNAFAARPSGSPVSVNQTSNALLATVWISIGLMVLAVNGVRRILDRRREHDYGARLSSTASAPAAADVAHAESPTTATPVGDTHDPDNGLERDSALRRIREVMSEGDIATIRFQSAASDASVFVEDLSDERIQALVSETLNDILKGQPQDALLDIGIGRIYFGGSDTLPYFKKSILVRKLASTPAAHDGRS